MRRVLVGLMFAAWVGVAPAQSPPARPAPQPAGDILIQKTAGQPERRLRLLRIETSSPDGERVADLQDLATGARYTVPVSALAGMKRMPAETAPPAPTPAKPTATGGKFPTSLPLPEPAPGSHSPFAARPFSPTPEPRSQAKWPDAPRAAPVAPVTLDTPLTAIVAAPARPVEPPLALPTPMPVVPDLSPRMPTAPIMPVAVPYTPPSPRPIIVMPPAEPILLSVVAAPAPHRPVVVPVSVAEPVTPPVVASPAPIRQAAFHMPAAPAVAAWQMTRAEQMRAEIEPYTSELVNALRPSVRERAASALANCRHASQPEVKQLLARTAMTDPAPTVQAHCVRILSALGYHATEYVEFLDLSQGSDHVGLRQAAVAALAKLTPR